MNEYDEQILNLINQERSKEGLSLLSWHSQLDIAAESYSQDMALQDFHGHTGSDGSTPGDRITAEGYQWSQWAENIGAGYETPEAVVEGWMNSTPHRDNILNSELEDIGIGYYYLENDTGSENWNHYWTVTFGAGGGDSPADLEPEQEVEFPIDLVEDLGLVDEPIQVSEGVWFLGEGIPSDELNIVRPDNINSADTINTDRLWTGGNLGLNLDGAGSTVGVCV